MSGTLNNVYNNVSYALSLHAAALARLQEQASTGSLINRPSDKPSAAYRILGLNSQERSLEGYSQTLSETMETLEVSLSLVEKMVAALAEEKVNLTQILSGVYTEEGRQRVAEGVNNTVEQLVQFANTQHLGQYLFSGTATATRPYALERTDGQITRVTYQGSYEDRQVDIGAGLQSSAFYVGDDIFRVDARQVPDFLGNTGARAGTGTSSVRGDVWLTVTHDGSNYVLSIDDGASTVTVPGGGSTNLAVASSVTGEVLYVDTTEITQTGVEMVSAAGTHDVFNTLIVIRDILNNDRSLSAAQLEEVRARAVESLDEVHNLLVQHEVAIGSKIGFLNDVQEGLADIRYNTQDETARIEEADIAQIAVDLSRREVLYQMSLSAAAKLLSMSLLDFLG